jgi:hypothetical protein
MNSGAHPRFHQGEVASDGPSDDDAPALGLAANILERALQAVWFYNSSPLRGLGERRWLEMFKEVGFVVVTAQARSHHPDGTSEDVSTRYEHLTARPTEPIEICRGAALQSKGRGMSWSVHRDYTREFAEAVANLGLNRPGFPRDSFPWFHATSSVTSLAA